MNKLFISGVDLPGQEYEIVMNSLIKHALLEGYKVYCPKHPTLTINNHYGRCFGCYRKSLRNRIERGELND